MFRRDTHFVNLIIILHRRIPEEEERRMKSTGAPK